MSPFSSLPPECLLFILQSCDTISQAIALSSTCKQLHSIYSSNMYIILRYVGPRDVPFNAALMAVRATRLVVDNFQKGQFAPNPFLFELLSEKDQEPSADDVREVLDWEHLIRCIEDICLHRTAWGRVCYYFIRRPNSPEWLTWRHNFRRSMYQSLMMGAILCRAYQEPLARAKREGIPEHFLEDCDKRLGRPLMKREEMAYLLKYPIYNFEDYEGHGPLYEELADFLREQTDNQPPCEPTVPDIGMDMYPEDATPETLDREHAKVLYTQMVQCLVSSMTLLGHTGGPPIFKKDLQDKEDLIRKVTVVRLGSFYPEVISMPASPQHAHCILVLKEPLPLETETSSWHASSRFMKQFLELVYLASGQPNHYGEEYPTPPPPWQIFQYICRTFLGVRFSADAFVEEETDSPQQMVLYHPFTCGMFLNVWPHEVPYLFEPLDEEAQYNAYFA